MQERLFTSQILLKSPTSAKSTRSGFQKHIVSTYSYQVGLLSKSFSRFSKECYQLGDKHSKHEHAGDISYSNCNTTLFIFLSVPCLAKPRQSSNLVSFIRCLRLVMTQLSTLALLLLMPSGNWHKTGSQNKYCILFIGFPSMECRSPDYMISLPHNTIIFFPVSLFFTVKKYIS